MFWKKYKNIIYSFINVILLSIVNTFKGAVIVECGYGWEYLIVESLSLLLTIILLYFLYITIQKGQCITVVNKRVKKE
jgi:uncharacterized membrane protein